MRYLDSTKFTVPYPHLNLRPAVKKAIILLLYRTDVKVLKDALAHLGPYQTLTSVRCSDPVVKIARHYTNLKNPHTNRFCMVAPIVSSKYRHL